MENHYLIKTIGKQTENGASNTVEVLTKGDYEYGEDFQRISYLECEGDLAGCKTVITARGDDFVETLREGSYSIRLTAEKQKRQVCYYDTPFGEMALGVFCRSIENSLGRNGGNLKFRYTLDVNSELVSENEVEIVVKEAAIQ